MRYTKKVSVGAFLKKGEDFKDGDLVTIANEGQQVEGQFGTQNVFLIKTASKEGNVGFNQTTLNNCIEAFGEEAVNWVGKKVKVWMIRQSVQGKITPVYYFLHPDTILDEKSGYFVLVGMNGAVAPKDEPEIVTEDIPF